MNKERDISLDILRCAACIAVVILHAAAVFWYSTPVGLKSVTAYEIFDGVGGGGYREIAWYACSLIDALTRFSVPVFIMVSGALIIAKDKLTKPYLAGKIKRVIIFILFYGFGFQIVINGGKVILEQNIAQIEDILSGIILGPNVFWFLFMLLPLYVTAPVSKYIAEDEEICRIFLLAWFVLTVCFDSLRTQILWMTDRNQFEYTSVYAVYNGYFILGYYYRKYGIGRKLEKGVLVLGFLSLLLIAVGKPEGWFHNFTTVLCFFYSFAVFILVHKIPLKKIGAVARWWIGKFSGYTMGIYAMHSLILTILNVFWKPCQEQWYLQLIIYIAAAIVFSMLYTLLMKKSRYFCKLV